MIANPSSEPLLLTCPCRILWSFKINPFERLNLRFDATIEEVKKQYRKLSLMVHPDKCKHPQAATAFDSGCCMGLALGHAVGSLTVASHSCRSTPTQRTPGLLSQPQQARRHSQTSMGGFDPSASWWCAQSWERLRRTCRTRRSARSS